MKEGETLMVKGMLLGLIAAFSVYLIFAAGVVVRFNRAHVGEAMGIDPIAIWHTIGLNPYLWGLATFAFVWVYRWSLR